MDLPPMHPHPPPVGTISPHHPSMYPPPPPPPPQPAQQPMGGIEAPHSNDVLCGRGVTTNRHPGNEKFRALVHRNKELYVTSTKRQKMGISRTIVEAVRARDPPGRFLEKDQATCLWFDIGDKKAIEKTSQALRDSAASLRKQLSEDLADPDFLQAVFDEKTAKELSEVDKPKKSSKPPKGHRRTRSDPMGGKPSKSAAKRPSVGPKDQQVTSRKSVSLTGPPSTTSSAPKSQKRSSTAKKSHKRTHSADSAPTKTLYSKESAPGSPYPHARRSSPASPCGYAQRMSPPASPFSYNRTWASPPNSPYTYNYGPGPPSPYHINHHRAQSWDVSYGYQQPSPGQHAPENGFKPVDGQKPSHGEGSSRNGENTKGSPSPVQYSNPQHSGFAPSSPTPYMPYPPSPHQHHMHSPYYQQHYPTHGSHSPGHPPSTYQHGPHSDQRPPSLVIPELGKDGEKNSRVSGGWFPKPQTSSAGSGSSGTPSSSGSRALGPRPHHYPYYQGHHHYPQASSTSLSPPSHWPQPPPSPRQKTASPDMAQQQSNWPNPPPSSSRQKDSPPSAGSQSRPPPSPRPGASSPRSLHTSRPPPSPRQRPCSPCPGQLPLHPPRPPPSPGHRPNSPGPAPTSLPPPRPPASPNFGSSSSPRDGSHKTHPPLHPPHGGGRASPMLAINGKRFSPDENTNLRQPQDGRNEKCHEYINEKPRKSFTFVDGKLEERTEKSGPGQDDGSFQKMTSSSAQHVTPSPEQRHQHHTERVSYRCSPEAVEAVESFDLSPVADIDQMDEDYEESGHSYRDPRKGGNGDDPALESMDADIEVSPLPYKTNPLQDLSSSPLRELNDNLLLLSPSSLSPPRGINMTPSAEDF